MAFGFQISPVFGGFNCRQFNECWKLNQNLASNNHHGPRGIRISSIPSRRLCISEAVSWKEKSSKSVFMWSTFSCKKKDFANLPQRWPPNRWFRIWPWKCLLLVCCRTEAQCPPPRWRSAAATISGPPVRWRRCTWRPPPTRQLLRCHDYLLGMTSSC